MAITLTNSNVEKAGFIANGNSADLSGCETLKAAVTGKSIYLERLVINSAAAINITIGAGETTGAVTTVLIGPISFAADNGKSNIEFVFTRPLKLAAATALVVDASGAGTVTLVAQGFIK